MNPPYIPHTSLDGTLITGWSGPCEVLAHARFPVALPDAAHLAMLQGKSAWVSCFLSLDACAGETLPRRNVCLDRGQNFSFDPSRCRMRLDPRREEVATRIATVLRRKGHEVGPLLPVALGGKVNDIEEIRDDGRLSCGCPDGCDERASFTHWDGAERCPKCKGPVGGYLVTRPEIPAADVSAVLLAASVAGVEAGRGVVRGVLGEWREDHWTHYRDGLDGHQRVWTYIRAGDRAHDGDGWAIGRPTKTTPKGPETGPEGRAAADAALLRLGYAYPDPTAPFGVVVPFLRDGWEVPSVCYGSGLLTVYCRGPHDFARRD